VLLPFRVAPVGLLASGLVLRCCCGLPRAAALCRTGDGSTGCPARQSISCTGGTGSRSPRSLCIPGSACCLHASGFPAACLLACVPPTRSCELPRLPYRSGFASDAMDRFPGPASFRRCRRSWSGFPLRRPFGIADDPPPACAVVRIFRLRLVILHGFRRRIAFRLCHRFDRRISPDRFPLAAASAGTCRSPRIFRFRCRRRPVPVSQVALEFWAFGAASLLSPSGFPRLPCFSAPSLLAWVAPRPQPRLDR